MLRSFFRQKNSSEDLPQTAVSVEQVTKKPDKINGNKSPRPDGIRPGVL